ncbi:MULTISPECIES: LuxR family transcriptional regulator [Thermodesulfovibrio]|jgi:RNA polymerase sigma factor (sigma-70 family)|uniref:LuxR family transcriptional regulator n=1 Tax=Thermodesulfovibrio TaxID=28261 RepID=UPI002635CEA8|nr:LuxR family transcriptional regulator [Thermodesulfovibrio sp.]
MHNWIKGALALSLYDFWLLSFPMGGNLVWNSETFNINYFLIAHIIALTIIPIAYKTDIPEKLIKAVTFLLALFTIIYPLSESYQTYLLIFIGFLSAGTVIKIMSTLNSSHKIPLSIGTGLAMGNFLVLILYYLPLSVFFKFLIIALALASVVFFPSHFSSETNLRDLKRYLPFIYVFYLIGGIFYGFLLSEYTKVAHVQGIELFFYVLFSLIGIYITRKDKDSTLAIGILLGMLSFSLIKIENPPLINLGMFSMQGALALVDFFLIFAILTSGCTVKAICYGVGVMCMALLSGNLITTFLSNAVTFLITVGNIILTISTLLFYFSGKKIRTTESIKPKEMQPEESFTLEERVIEKPRSADVLLSHKIEEILSTYQKKFSPKEMEVLKLLLQRKTYKEIAQELQISESSVKTYVKRISDKLNVHGKEGILNVLSKKP